MTSKGFLEKSLPKTTRLFRKKPTKNTGGIKKAYQKTMRVLWIVS
jgi:hypothetical protein